MIRSQKVCRVVAAIGLSGSIALLPALASAQTPQEELANFAQFLQTSDSTRPNPYVALMYQGVTLARLGRIDEAIASFRAFERIAPRATPPREWVDLGMHKFMPMTAVASVALLEARRGNVDASLRELARLRQAGVDSLDGRLDPLVRRKREAWAEQARAMDSLLAKAGIDSLRRREQVRKAVGPPPQASAEPVYLDAAAMPWYAIWTAAAQLEASVHTLGIDLLARGDLRGVDWLLWLVPVKEKGAERCDEREGWANLPACEVHAEVARAVAAAVRAGAVTPAALARRIRQLVGEPGEGYTDVPGKSDMYVSPSAALAAAHRLAIGRALWAASEATGHADREVALLAVELQVDHSPAGGSGKPVVRFLQQVDLGLGTQDGSHLLCAPGQPNLRLRISDNASEVWLELPRSRSGSDFLPLPVTYSPRTRELRADVGVKLLNNSPVPAYAKGLDGDRVVNEERFALAGVLSRGGELRGRYSWRLCR